MQAKVYENLVADASKKISVSDFFEMAYEFFEDGFEGDTFLAICAIADAMDEMEYSDTDAYYAIYEYFTVHKDLEANQRLTVT